jgi:phospholipid transport system substrate-binding protein
MISRLLLAFVAFPWVISTQCSGQDSVELSPSETVHTLCDALISAMKQGPSLGYSGRLRMLDPQIRRALDLPLMTRLVVGPPWRSLKLDEQQRLIEAFSDYSIAVYASRFKAYGGERFIVDPATTNLANSDVIVHTRLVPGEGDPVQLDYLLRKGANGWKVIDVFLSGTISELATRRSEYSSVLRMGGAEALISVLQKKTAELSG